MDDARPTKTLVGTLLFQFVRDSTGGMVNTRELRGKPMVLLFVPSPEEQGCRLYLQAFADDIAEYQRLDAVVVAVSTASSDAVQESALPVIWGAHDLFVQFRLVQETRLRVGVVIVDRYGIVDQCFSAVDCSGLPGEPRIAQLLQGAESVCPECGVPEARWLEATE